MAWREIWIFVLSGTMLAWASPGLAPRVMTEQDFVSQMEQFMIGTPAQMTGSTEQTTQQFCAAAELVHHIFGDKLHIVPVVPVVLTVRTTDGSLFTRLVSSSMDLELAASSIIRISLPNGQPCQHHIKEISSYSMSEAWSAMDGSTRAGYLAVFFCVAVCALVAIPIILLLCSCFSCSRKLWGYYKRGVCCLFACLREEKPKPPEPSYIPTREQIKKFEESLFVVNLDNEAVYVDPVQPPEYHNAPSEKTPLLMSSASYNKLSRGLPQVPFVKSSKADYRVLIVFAALLATGLASYVMYVPTPACAVNGYDVLTGHLAIQTTGCGSFDINDYHIEPQTDGTYEVFFPDGNGVHCTEEGAVFSPFVHGCVPPLYQFLNGTVMEGGCVFGNHLAQFICGTERVEVCERGKWLMHRICQPTDHVYELNVTFETNSSLRHVTPTVVAPGRATFVDAFAQPIIGGRSLAFDQMMLPEGVSLSEVSSRTLGLPTSCDGRVVGGVVGTAEVAAIAVAIQVLDRIICSGFIVAPGVVITAAHCTVYRNFHDYNVCIGIDTKNMTCHPVTGFSDHPSYRAVAGGGDISVLLVPKLNTTVCFPLRNPVGEFSKCWAVGYGVISEGGPLANTLMMVDLYKTPCNNYKGDEYLCAWKQGGDTCQGDSGGLLFCNDTVGMFPAAIVSHGYGCANSIPGFYTSLSKYKSFVETKIGSYSYQTVVKEATNAPTYLHLVTVGQGGFTTHPRDSVVAISLENVTGYLYDTEKQYLSSDYDCTSYNGTACSEGCAVAGAPLLNGTLTLCTGSPSTPHKHGEGMAGTGYHINNCTLVTPKTVSSIYTSLVAMSVADGTRVEVYTSTQSGNITLPIKFAGDLIMHQDFWLSVPFQNLSYLGPVCSDRVLNPPGTYIHGFTVHTASDGIFGCKRYSMELNQTVLYNPIPAILMRPTLNIIGTPPVARLRLFGQTGIQLKTAVGVATPCDQLQTLWFGSAFNAPWDVELIVSPFRLSDCGFDTKIGSPQGWIQQQGSTDDRYLWFKPRPGHIAPREPFMIWTTTGLSSLTGRRAGREAAITGTLPSLNRRMYAVSQAALDNEYAARNNPISDSLNTNRSATIALIVGTVLAILSFLIALTWRVYRLVRSASTTAKNKIAAATGLGPEEVVVTKPKTRGARMRAKRSTVLSCSLVIWLSVMVCLVAACSYRGQSYDADDTFCNHQVTTCAYILQEYSPPPYRRDCDAGLVTPPGIVLPNDHSFGTLPVTEQVRRFIELNCTVDFNLEAGSSNECYNLDAVQTVFRNMMSVAENDHLLTATSECVPGEDCNCLLVQSETVRRLTIGRPYITVLSCSGTTQVLGYTVIDAYQDVRWRYVRSGAFGIPFVTFRGTTVQAQHLAPNPGYCTNVGYPYFSFPKRRRINNCPDPSGDRTFWGTTHYYDQCDHNCLYPNCDTVCSTPYSPAGNVINCQYADGFVEFVADNTRTAHMFVKPEIVQTTVYICTLIDNKGRCFATVSGEVRQNGLYMNVIGQPQGLPDNVVASQQLNGQWVFNNGDLGDVDSTAATKRDMIFQGLKRSSTMTGSFPYQPSIPTINQASSHCDSGREVFRYNYRNVTHPGSPPYFNYYSSVSSWGFNLSSQTSINDSYRHVPTLMTRTGLVGDGVSLSVAISKNITILGVDAVRSWMTYFAVENCTLYNYFSLGSGCWVVISMTKGATITLISTTPAVLAANTLFVPAGTTYHFLEASSNTDVISSVVIQANVNGQVIKENYTVTIDIPNIYSTAAGTLMVAAGSVSTNWLWYVIAVMAVLLVIVVYEKKEDKPNNSTTNTVVQPPVLDADAKRMEKVDVNAWGSLNWIPGFGKDEKPNRTKNWLRDIRVPSNKGNKWYPQLKQSSQTALVWETGIVLMALFVGVSVALEPEITSMATGCRFYSSVLGRPLCGVSPSVETPIPLPGEVLIPAIVTDQNCTGVIKSCSYYITVAPTGPGAYHTAVPCCGVRTLASWWVHAAADRGYRVGKIYKQMWAPSGWGSQVPGMESLFYANNAPLAFRHPNISVLYCHNFNGFNYDYDIVRPKLCGVMACEYSTSRVGCEVYTGSACSSKDYYKSGPYVEARVPPAYRTVMDVDPQPETLNTCPYAVLPMSQVIGADVINMTSKMEGAINWHTFLTNNYPKDPIKLNGTVRISEVQATEITSITLDSCVMKQWYWSSYCTLTVTWGGVAAPHTAEITSADPMVMTAQYVLLIPAAAVTKHNISVIPRVPVTSIALTLTLDAQKFEVSTSTIIETPPLYVRTHTKVVPSVADRYASVVGMSAATLIYTLIPIMYVLFLVVVCGLGIRPAAKNMLKSSSVTAVLRLLPWIIGLALAGMLIYFIYSLVSPVFGAATSVVSFFTGRAACLTPTVYNGILFYYQGIVSSPYTSFACGELCITNETCAAWSFYADQCFHIPRDQMATLTKVQSEYARSYEKVNCQLEPATSAAGLNFQTIVTVLIWALVARLLRNVNVKLTMNGAQNSGYQYYGRGRPWRGNGRGRGKNRGRGRGGWGYPPQQQQDYQWPQEFVPTQTFNNNKRGKPARPASAPVKNQQQAKQKDAMSSIGTKVTLCKSLNEYIFALMNPHMKSVKALGSRVVQTAVMDTSVDLQKHVLVTIALPATSGLQYTGPAGVDQVSTAPIRGMKVKQDDEDMAVIFKGMDLSLKRKDKVVAAMKARRRHDIEKVFDDAADKKVGFTPLMAFAKVKGSGYDTLMSEVASNPAKWFLANVADWRKADTTSTWEATSQPTRLHIVKNTRYDFDAAKDLLKPLFDDPDALETALAERDADDEEDETEGMSSTL